ncbi:hypothetical protein [Allostreptomyces psammosilenae]|uniref:Cupin n=1 Tax=Allostreptomyces psammosilenae TaxID=1892865 RepID=A0A853A2F8_9ACTN|nr:hypothetical protein [Allostreptomyces psammosilenae]NYI08307.1 hypothetical protein [Allostreptomyces psammosilenae]
MEYTVLEGLLARGEVDAVPPRALATLAEIADGRRALLAVRHPLGFLCLPVQREGDLGVCVHLFNPWSAPWNGGAPVETERPTTSEVHCHSWDMTSVVLSGHVENTWMRVSDSTGPGEEPTHRVFEVHSSDGTDRIVPTDRVVRCAPARVERSGPGQVYTLPAGEFHTSTVDDRTTAVTVVLGRARASRTDLSLGPLDAGSHVVDRRLCDRSETVRVAEAIAGRIHAAHADL